MHDAAMSFVVRALDTLDFDPRGKSIVEIGSRDVNGSVRPLFAGCDAYIGIDTRAGRGVDVVADGSVWGEPGCCDIVVCTETLEHATDPAAVIANASRILRPGGALILTTAGPERPMHGNDGGAVGDEHYQNIDPDDLDEWLEPFFEVSSVERNPVPYHDDVYAMAIKGSGKRRAAQP